MKTHFASTGPSHPFALAMTALLLLNDHVLKATWPGLITGKLSDVAFLVVAPVVVAAALSALRVPDRTARRVALWSIGIFFVALQIWAPLGDTLAGMLGGQHTADLTDLLTLPALALTTLAWRPTERVPLALPIAALACVATSWFECPDTRYPANGAILDPNEPLVLSFGRNTPPFDHPALPRSVHLFDEAGDEIELLFARGIHACPRGGLEPSATYSFVIEPLDAPGSNTTGVFFGDTGTTTFTTAATSVLPTIQTVNECARAQVIGEFEPCAETGLDTATPDTANPDTADTSDGS